MKYHSPGHIDLPLSLSIHDPFITDESGLATDGVGCLDEAHANHLVQSESVGRIGHVTDVLTISVQSFSTPA